VLAVLALTACGAGLAAWLTQGSGTGSARVGTMQALTFAEASPAGATPVYPGGDGDLVVSVTNPNGPLTLTSVQSDTTVTAQNPNGWSAADVTDGSCSGGYATVSATGLSVPVASGTSTITVPAAVHLGLSAPSACQGHTLKLWITGTAST
jgi:hypothetical protein